MSGAIGPRSQTIVVALGFWLACLLLVLLEVVFGAKSLSAGLFVLAIPALVVALAWSQRRMLSQPVRAMSVLALGVSVFVYGATIVFVGLLLASAVKRLLQ